MKFLSKHSNKINHKFLFQSNNSIETSSQIKQVDQKQQKESLDNFKTLGTIQSSVDQKKLLQDIEAKNVEPLGKETIEFVVKFLKEIGEINHGAFRFKISNDESVNLIKDNPAVERIQNVESPYIYIKREGAANYISDLNGKIVVPNNGVVRGLISRGRKIGKTKEQVVDQYKKDGQTVINNTFITLSNYY